MNRTPHRTLATGALLLAVGLTACSSTPEPSSLASASPTMASSPSPTVTEPVILQGAPTAEVIDRLLIKDGLNLPWDIAWDPDGTMLVTQSDSGQIWRYKDGTSDYLVGAGADWLKANVDPTGEGGLLGIAILPSNPAFIYVYLSRTDGNAVVRMLHFGQTLGAPTEVVTGMPKNSYHNGGRIRFGPDGFLYITSGDAGNRPAAQDLNSLSGKILRVVANGTAEDGTVPADNPFGTLVWSYGHRNPQGIAWTSDGRMYSSELGQNTLDELNLIEPGRNYGWPMKEAIIGAPEGTAPGATVDGYTYPVAWWSTADASPSGITITDEAIYMAALRGQRVWRIPLTPDGVGTPQVLLNDLGRIRLVAQGPDGFLYVMTSNGGNTDKIVRIIVQQVDG